MRLPDTYISPAETGLYYLQSRYYDAKICRFISPDAVISGVGGDILGYNRYAYCFNNPVNLEDESGNWPSLSKFVKKAVSFVKTKIIEPIKKWKANIIKYDVPLYDQGDTSICWAYCQTMIEDSKNDIKRTKKEASKRAKEIAVQKHGEENWNQGSKPTNRSQVEIVSIEDIHTALNSHGPLYASYGKYENGKRVSGHAIVITGVNLNTNRVYTNNPWGRRGSQKYDDFVQVFVGTNDEGWKLDACYYLY